jgi:hypothetical protein
VRFEDRIPVCRPFFCLLLVRKSDLGILLDAVHARAMTQMPKPIDLRKARDDYGNIVRCLNGMHPEWNKLTDSNLSWLRSVAHKHLDQGTLAWVREQGIKV